MRDDEKIIDFHSRHTDASRFAMAATHEVALGSIIPVLQMRGAPDPLVSEHFRPGPAR